MKNLFVNPNDTFEVNVCIGTGKNSLPEIKEKIDKNDKDATEYSITFRRPGYGDNVQILSSSLKVVDGAIQLDPNLLRYERFCTLIKEWTFKDENDRIMEITRKNINKLNPDVANFVIAEMEKKLETM